jgi:hypothetical protein
VTPEADPVLRRLEREALVCCAALAIVALVIRGGRPDVALGVLGGGLLTGLSYWTIKAAVTGLVRAITPAGREADAGVTAKADDDHGGTSTAVDRPGSAGGTGPGMAWLAFRIAGRYALLILTAYVMIARLRLHPVGLLMGASSFVAAAGIEAVRALAGATAGDRR